MAGIPCTPKLSSIVVAAVVVVGSDKICAACFCFLLFGICHRLERYTFDGGTTSPINRTRNFAYWYSILSRAKRCKTGLEMQNAV